MTASPSLEPAAPWTGRDDGPGPEHDRVHRRVDVASSAASGGAAAAGLLGFASDEGVRRNRGRPGAAAGPAALRAALSNLAIHADVAIVDHGDVVSGADLEAGQQRLGEELARIREDSSVTVVLGGGHETAYGSHLGLRPLLETGARLGILNLDAHFDLRDEPVATSGTPFLQIANDEAAAARSFTYTVLGIAWASNTPALFDTAESLGVTHVLDVDLQSPVSVDDAVAPFLADLDAVYLTIDLDVLPPGQAMGVSAPASLGVPLAVVEKVCRLVAASGKLTHVDVVELNPELDRDATTARSAARLIHTIVSTLTADAGDRP